MSQAWILNHRVRRRVMRDSAKCESQGIFKWTFLWTKTRFMAALLAGWIKDIKVNFNIGPLTPTRGGEIFMMQHKISGGWRSWPRWLTGYCEAAASSYLTFCVHDTPPIKLIRRFELFSYLIQFVTGCKLGSVFTNTRIQSEYKVHKPVLLVGLYLGASWWIKH